jgi:hypothetical protein
VRNKIIRCVAATQYLRRTSAEILFFEPKRYRAGRASRLFGDFISLYFDLGARFFQHLACSISLGPRNALEHRLGNAFYYVLGCSQTKARLDLT